MAENIAWFLSKEKPSNRILIWAHDYHISRGDYENNIYNGLSMGVHLSKKFGDNYKAFAIATYNDDYREMISCRNFKSMECPLYKSPKGTLDEVLHRSTLKNKSIGMILNLKDARKQKMVCKINAYAFCKSYEHKLWLLD